jgi:hypothetical protein
MGTVTRHHGRLALAATVVAVIGLATPARAADGPTATITPSTGLTNGKVVTVTGSGFPPSDAIVLTECAGTVADPPTDAISCDGNTTDASANADIRGNFVNAPGANNGSNGYTVRAVGMNGVLGITCDATHPCVLYVGVQLDDFSQPHTFVDLQWAASVTARTVPASSTVPTSGGSSSTTVPSAGGSSTTAPSAGGSSSTVAPTTTSPAGGSSPPGVASPTAALPGATSGGQLAQTGMPGNPFLIFAIAVALIVGSTIVRRTALRGEHDR